VVIFIDFSYWQAPFCHASPAKPIRNFVGSERIMSSIQEAGLVEPGHKLSCQAVIPIDFGRDTSQGTEEAITLRRWVMNNRRV
jgi:hypothetical protein